ncbi:transmembrane protein 231 [Nymphalis io]|uniref:transmembrane protein 231 n=1 Tax=Inachis io TaxID=171585 RepID=UPI0021688BD3|nr:transmembrane protein 231 [Nymphalis io]XP_050361474.1 transmembrane protein 231 [Nymphalis io]
MALYKLFSHSVEIQYKSYFLSKATLFTVLIAVINLILPFIIAFNSKGFWLQSHYFYEQPLIRSTYDYLLIAETDDPSINIICGEVAAINSETIEHEENCVETQIWEHDFNKDGTNDIIEFKFHLIIPKQRTITYIILILGIDLQIKTTCPLQMQSLAVINKEFGVHPNGLKYYGDIQIYQSVHLPCVQNIIDTKYNSSIFTQKKDNKNIVDSILEEYLSREVITTVTPIFSRNHNGLTGTMDLNIVLKISEMRIRYLPSLLQELKWAWPQYLSLLLIFYYIFNRLKRFVFNKRLLMAWKIVPWTKKD